MRHLAIWRLVIVLLLAAVPLAGPVIDGSAATALADNGNGKGGDNDGNRGHGNDPDGVDEDNPGKSGEKKPDKDEKPEKKEKPVETVPGAGYTVAIDCHLTEDAAGTTCDIAATAPEGGKKVGFVQLPADAVCAEVLATDADLAEPDPATHVAGYTSPGKGGALSITLDGQVTTAGTATYWVRTGDGIFPVEGPGLRCDLAGDATPNATVTFEVDVTPTPAAMTGTVEVVTLTCADVPADTTGFDWFGACQPGADPAREFALAPSDAGAAITATTDASGTATFADLAPGEYRLDLTDGAWCHANADRVTADSEVVVEAGATSTVWIFLCDGATGA
jgi:hypothetical protein